MGLRTKVLCDHPTSSNQSNSTRSDLAQLYLLCEALHLALGTRNGSGSILALEKVTIWQRTHWRGHSLRRPCRLSAVCTCREAVQSRMHRNAGPAASGPGYLMASVLGSLLGLAQRHCWKNRHSSIRQGVSLWAAPGRGPAVTGSPLRSC